MMSSQFHVPQSKADADPRRWVALAVLLLASFMNLIDVTIVNVALPSLQSQLGADANDIEWVIAAYVLAFALGLLPFGRLGDIVGRTQDVPHRRRGLHRRLGRLRSCALDRMADRGARRCRALPVRS